MTDGDSGGSLISNWPCTESVNKQQEEERQKLWRTPCSGSLINKISLWRAGVRQGCDRVTRQRGPIKLSV